MDKHNADQSHPVSSSSANQTPAQKNLSDIKVALEQIMLATTESSVTRASANAADAANIARLHSFAADAYAHIMTMIAAPK